MLTLPIILFIGLVSSSLILIFGTRISAKYFMEKYNSSSSKLDLGTLFSTFKKIRDMKRERSLPEEDIPIYENMKKNYSIVIFCIAASFILWIYIETSIQIKNTIVQIVTAPYPNIFYQETNVLNAMVK